MMKKFFYFILLASLTLSINSFAVGIDEAYAAIPHKRTQFDPQQSRLPSDQARSLVGLFALVEQALVLKVDGLQAMEANNSKNLQKIIDGYDVLLLDLTSYPTPTSLQSARDAIASAVELHRAHFKYKLKNHNKFEPYDLSFTPEIYEASNYLRQAYQYLMENGSEIQKNKISFYDYLCSLDFI